MIKIKDKYESRLLSTLLPVCQNLHVHQLNVPSPFVDRKGTRFQLHLQNGSSSFTKKQRVVKKQ